jgi:hypothetical protein
MKFFGDKLNLDFIGLYASLACAIHCAVLPIVVSVSAIGGLSFLEHGWFELGMIGFSTIIAGKALLEGYFKKHRKTHPVFIGSLGIALLIGSQFAADNVEAILATAGGLSVAFSHYINWQLSKKYYNCALSK